MLGHTAQGCETTSVACDKPGGPTQRGQWLDLTHEPCNVVVKTKRFRCHFLFAVFMRRPVAGIVERKAHSPAIAEELPHT